MSNLDDKLKEILQPWLEEIVSEYGTGRDDYKKQPFIDFNNAISRITQAFADENYIQVPNVIHDIDKGSWLEVNSKQVMTGQEWLDRFDKITDRMLEATGRKLTDMEYMEAAERASGLK